MTAEPVRPVDLGRSRKPRLLDLFCGAGGAAMGYHRAGFEVVGVDIKPQPHYPFEFWRNDAIQVLRETRDWVSTFNVIHASPPCQHYSAGTRVAGNQAEYPDFVPPIQALLDGSGLPYVIENVPGAPLRFPLTLCGSQFGLRGNLYFLERHRLFEINPELFNLLPSCQHQKPVIGLYGDHGADRRRSGKRFPLPVAKALSEASAAMGIDWMNWVELKEAIPPAYTEWIGRQLIAILDRSAEVSA